VTAPVFLAPAAPREAGGQYVLDGAEGRHAAVAQRLQVGERLDIVDGQGTRLRAVVTELRGAQLVFTVESVVREPASPLRLTLVQALAKADRDEQAVEAAVECGVDAVIPWQADRSIVQWRGERAHRARARWESRVLAATKQARRSWLPPVGGLVTSRQLAARGPNIVVLDAAATMALADVALPPSGELLVAVGPEGGVSEAELAALQAAGAQAARLGPHVMRTSTAGPVAIALLSQRLGRWN
jgi:16S rRNA (uracil1498-N3)-methyltransferase